MTFQVSGARHWHNHTPVASVRPQADEATNTEATTTTGKVDRCQGKKGSAAALSNDVLTSSSDDKSAQLKEFLNKFIAFIKAQQASKTAASTSTENQAAAADPATSTPDNTSNSLADAAAARNRTTNAAQKTRLNNVLAEIANDPEGKILLQAAIDKGYTFSVKNLGDGTNGETYPDKKQIAVNPNAPDFEKTLVHELVHAATDGDGDSKDEEGKADVIGFRVASRILGKSGPNEQQIYNAKISNPAYANLGRTNNVDASLARLGITAFVA
jgi:ubiquitin